MPESTMDDRVTRPTKPHTGGACSCRFRGDACCECGAHTTHLAIGRAGHMYCPKPECRSTEGGDADELQPRAGDVARGESVEAQADSASAVRGDLDETRLAGSPAAPEDSERRPGTGRTKVEKGESLKDALSRHEHRAPEDTTIRHEEGHPHATHEWALDRDLATHFCRLCNYGIEDDEATELCRPAAPEDSVPPLDMIEYVAGRMERGSANDQDVGALRHALKLLRAPGDRSAEEDATVEALAIGMYEQDHRLHAPPDAPHWHMQGTEIRKPYLDFARARLLFAAPQANETPEKPLMTNTEESC